MKNQAYIFAALFFVLSTFTFSLNAQENNANTVVEIQATDVDYSNTRSLNPNIKIAIPENDKNPMPATKKKGSDASKGNECEIIFDNYTGYYIEVYVDGIYKGTVGEWGTLYVTVRGGYTKIYALTTGATKEWKAEGNCEGNYIWKLK